MENTENQYTCSSCGAGLAREDRYCRNCGTICLASSSSPKISPMFFGDIFNRIIQLTGSSFIRYIMIASVIFIPTSLVIILAASEFYSAIGRTIDNHDITGLFRFQGLIIIAYIISGIAYLAGTIAVISIVNGEIRGQHISWREALTNSFSIFLLRAIGQFLIIFIITAAAVAFLGFVTMIFSLIFDTIIILIPFFFIAFIAGIFVYYRIAFALPVVVSENAGAFQGLIRSWSLVKGHWWRVFGILLLFGVMSGFAISILTTPVSLFSLFPFYRELFSGLNEGATEIEVMAATFKSMGVGVGISSSVYLILTAFITPIYTTILYFDLRARHGEFISPDDPPSVNDNTVPGTPV